MENQMEGRNKSTTRGKRYKKKIKEKWPENQIKNIYIYVYRIGKGTGVRAIKIRKQREKFPSILTRTAP